jgi:RND family efflux transporter MFP subunit
MSAQETKPTRADRRRRKTRTRRRAIASGFVVIVAVATGIAVSRVSASGSPSYRTAVVTTSSVSRTLEVSGALEPVNQATADFQISGTVAAVDVRSGQEVGAGKVIATLNTSTLRAEVSEAETTLASAKADLTENEADESSSSSTSERAGTSTAGSSAAAVATVATATAPASTRTVATLTKDQTGVVTDQHTVDTDIGVTAGDLDRMKAACVSPTTSATSATGTTGATSTSIATSGASSPTCANALDTASTAETREATDQKKLSTAASTLTDLLESEVKSSDSSAGHTSTTQSASTTPSNSNTDTDTPKQLASDQSTIDSDEAALARASQSLDEATLVSPISGTVEEVDIAAGDSVTSGSSTYAVTIVDWGSYEVTGTLTTTQAQAVTVGQDAQITVDGVAGAMDGKVTRVGPVDESDSSYTYPLIVTITSPTAKMADGSEAHAVIDLKKVDGALVVPTSAVHTSAANDSYVYLDEAGKEVRQKVTTGLVGDVYTQIASGLELGDVIVLANPSEAVPSSSTNTTSTAKTLGGSSGGFTGGAGRFAGPGGGIGGTGGPPTGTGAG